MCSRWRSCRRQRRRTPLFQSRSSARPFSSGTVSQQPESDHRLHVGDLPAPYHRARFGESKRARFDVLVLIDFRRLVRRRQPRKPEEDHFLSAVARRWQEGAESDDRVRHLTDLLVTLAGCGRFGFFSWIDTPGWQLPQPSAYRIAVL